MLVPKRFYIVVAFLACTCAVVVVASLFFGAAGLSIKQVFAVLYGSSVEEGHIALVGVRLARGIAAMTVGALLSIAGVLAQTVLRNPLADPYILGISGGAGLGAICVPLLAGGIAAASAFTSILPAALGALLAVSVILLTESKMPRIGVEGLILLGVMINALSGSLIIAAASFLGEMQLMSFFRWMLGSFSILPFTAAGLIPAAAFTLIALALLTANGRRLNLLMLNSDEAASLGINVAFTRRIVLGTAGLLTAVAVSLAGLVGFVGLLVPHISRRLWGGDLRILIPSSALIGGALLVLCDTLARSLMRPSELPVGVITALIGAPAFVFILLARSGSTSR